MNAAQWTTNTTLEHIAQLLRQTTSVVTLTHTKPDGDALGATLALVRTLKQLGIDATAAFTGPWPHRFDSLLRDTPILHTGIESIDDGLLGNPDIAAILDTGSWSQLCEAKSFLKPRPDRNILIDHHLHGDADVAHHRFIDTSAAAVCRTITTLCTILLQLDSPAKLPEPIAEPLYLGIATDTGWFKFANVKPETLETAAELLRAGVRHALLHETVEQSDRPQRLLLEARALASMQLSDNDKISLCTITLEDFAQTNGGPEDTGSFSSIPLRISTVVVSVVITQLELNRCKASLRSKTAPDGGPAVNVNRVAMALGGGGHAQAAGCSLDTTLEDAQQRILHALRQEMHAETTV